MSDTETAPVAIVNTEAAAASLFGLDLSKITSADDFAKQMELALETAAVAAITAKAGPLAGTVAKMLIGEIVGPIVGTLSVIVSHIGMAVPVALGELTEKIEAGIHFDLNGDGFVGDPDKK